MVNNIYRSIDLIDNIYAGFLCGMSLGAVITQKTLNTFHSAGSNEGVSKGSARIQEIFNNSSTLNKTIFTVKNIRDSSKLKFTRFKDLVIDPPHESSLESCLWLDKWIEYFGHVHTPSEPHIIISIKLDFRRQVDKNFYIASMGQINWGDDINSPIPIACSPLMMEGDACLNELLVAFRYNIDTLRDIGNEILGSNFNFDEILLYFIDKVWIPKFLNIGLYGIEGVEDVFNNGGDSVIVCDSFSSILDFVHIDPIHIICNKTCEMLRVFGIEVARRCLIIELCSIVPGIYPCHIILLVDYMTWSGKINSISRYSVRQDPDTLKRMSFEEAIRNVVIACINGELDPLVSLSSQIATSKRVISNLQ